MNNRRVVGWIVGVGCVIQFATWSASVDALVPGFVEPAETPSVQTPRQAPPPTTTSSAPAPAPTSAAPTPTPRRGTAAYALEKLPVWTTPVSGYRRAKFGRPWADIDHNGCDQRNDTLRRDARKRHTKPGSHGCILQSGILVNPYTGNSIKFDRGDGDVQIDHVVSLGDAWRSGAGAYVFTAEQRRLLANDPMNLEATSSHSNQAKGDDTADEWLPTEWTYGVHCRYVARQVAIKTRHGLSVNPGERDAMRRVLANCPEEKLPKLRQFMFPAPRPIGEPKPKAEPKVTPRRTPPPHTRQQPRRAAPRHGVHPGAFCAPSGARGVTVTGRAMVCKSTSKDPRNRWRS